MEKQPINSPSDNAYAEAPSTLPCAPICRLQTDVPSTEACLARQHEWSDLEVQHRLASLSGTPPHRELLRVALEKIQPVSGTSFTNYWAEQNAWNGYGSTAAILACSTYAKQEDFIQCGYSTFSCQDRWFCPRCCFNKFARPVLEEFGGAFGADNDTYFIVMSLSQNPDEKQRLIFKDVGEDEFQNLKLRDTLKARPTQDYGTGFDNSDDMRDCRILWSFYKAAIHEFTGSDRGSLFSATLGGPELAVRFQPLRVLPHANYVAWSPGFSSDGARQLRKFVREKMRNSRHLQANLFPAVACYRLRSADDLRRVISYIFKPIDIAGAYLRAAESISYDPAAMENMNLEINMFLKNLADVAWQLRRVTRYGRCAAVHNDYFGHVTEYRQMQRERDAERRMHADRNTGQVSGLNDIMRWELHHLDQLDRPFCFRYSRFSVWKEKNERSPRPPSIANLSLQAQKKFL